MLLCISMTPLLYLVTAMKVMYSWQTVECSSVLWFLSFISPLPSRLFWPET